MKRLLLLLLFPLALSAQPTPAGGAAPATQTEVDAGVVPNKYVSPKTLNAWSGAGGSPGGSIGDWQYKSGATTFGGYTPATNWVTLFGTPTSANLAGWLTDETGYSSGALSVFSINPTLNGITLTGPPIYTPTSQTYGATMTVDVTKPLTTVSLTGNTTETFSATPTVGARITREYTADSTARVVTPDNNSGNVYFNSLKTTAATFTVPASTTMTVTYERQTSRWVAYGTDVAITDSAGTAFVTGVVATASVPQSTKYYEQTTNGTNYVNIVAPASVASNRTATLPDASGTIALTSGTYHSVGTAIVGASGGVITTGVAHVPITVPFAGTITNIYIAANASGSITIDVLRSASTASAPSVSMVGAGTKPALSGAASVTIAAPSNWTSATFAAGDTVDFQVTTADGVLTAVTIIIVYQ